MAAAEIRTGGQVNRDRMRDRIRDMIANGETPRAIDDDADELNFSDVIKPDSQRRRERFIPVTRSALMDRLTFDHTWLPGQAKHARRFFRYLDYWRQQKYSAWLLDLEQTYEPFSPDSELLQTRGFSPTDRRNLQGRVLSSVQKLLEQANYERIDTSDVNVIMTKDSHYGLDFNVDIGAFEEIMIYYRGASNKKYEQRRWTKFGRREEFDVPVFRRLFLLFKLKPFDARVEEMIRKNSLTREQATKKVQKLRCKLPDGMRDDLIYMKLFKNIPRADLEMVFPNTQIKFLMKDKLRLGATAGGGLGAGVVGAAGKLAVIATSPMVALGAAAGLGSVAFKQAMGFVNQKQEYLLVMAQKLYSNTLADNRGVILQVAASAIEQDIKEEMLLYCVLAKEPATRAELPAVDHAIEQYLIRTFGIKVDFDIYDALDRLIRDGIVKELPDGRLQTLGPADAAQHIDTLWDRLLDELPDPITGAGAEMESSDAQMRA